MRATRSAGEQHRDWLALVDTDGPFLSVPALKAVYPQGIAPMDRDRRASLVAAKREFEKAYEQWSKDRDAGALRAPRDTWVDFVLRDAVGWGDTLRWGLPLTARGPAAVSEHGVTVEASAALQRGDDDPAALVLVVDPVTSLRDLLDEAWSGSPIDRMESLLRATGVPIGVVTDGRWWALVSAPDEGMAASGEVDAQTWVEEAGVRDAFVELLSKRRLLGGAEDERLPAMFKDSVAAAEEITEALGTQVRKAVELLVSAFSEAAEDARRAGSPDPLPTDRSEVYEAAVTVMMRVVFLLFAEERGLLPEGRLFSAGYGIAGELDALDERAREEGTEALDATYLTWHRLLATTQALYAGATFEDMRLPSYGGSLFDARRYPFLVRRDERGALAVRVSDRVMLEVLRAVQVANLKTAGDARRISFRTVDVEQIGYIYEGLLGYTCHDVHKTTVGLIGKDGLEPEITLAELEALRARFRDDERLADELLAQFKRTQPAAKPPSKSVLVKALRADAADDAERALLAITRDQNLITRLRPFVSLIRRDLRDRPVVIQPGGLVVAETPSRANAGAHYTPKSLAREVVTHALRPLVYSPGPYQTDDEDAWVALSSNQLLDLRVADIACGSGAFLVAAAEYLAERLVEAWHREGQGQGTPAEMRTRAVRKVVARCLYGADINGMAVEMCKLSLWLVSLDAKLPFSFVDDKVLHGNSLLGLTHARQLVNLHIRPPATTHETLESAYAAVEVEQTLSRAADLRRALASEVDEADPERSTATKHRLMHELAEITAKQTLIADGVVAAGLPLGGKPGRALNEAYETLRHAVARAFPERDEGDPAWLESIVRHGLTPEVPTDYQHWQPLHWLLAVPDVKSRGGFDAVIGNPPFLGAPKITAAIGPTTHNFVANELSDGQKGKSDLVAFFVLRAISLLRRGGAFGLIATATVSEGDTKEVGLARLASLGASISRAIVRRPWLGSASVPYSVVWGRLGEIAPGFDYRINDAPVSGIGPDLRPPGAQAVNLVPLPENRGRATIGIYMLGSGFAVDSADERLLADAGESDVLMPLLSGDDVNSKVTPAPSATVIDLSRLELNEAVHRYPVAVSLLQARVKPERDGVARAAYRNRWWQFADRKLGPRALLEQLEWCLVMRQSSDTLMPWRVRTDQLFDKTLVVFNEPTFAGFAALSAAPHILWALRYGPTLASGKKRYAPSDVFETFPMVPESARLEALGESLHRVQRECMLAEGVGLSALYKLVNSSRGDSHASVERLRALQCELDRAVLDAYGWTDLQPIHGLYSFGRYLRWTVDPESGDEIVRRLQRENQRRTGN